MLKALYKVITLSLLTSSIFAASQGPDQGLHVSTSQATTHSSLPDGPRIAAQQSIDWEELYSLQQGLASQDSQGGTGLLADLPVTQASPVSPVTTSHTSAAPGHSAPASDMPAAKASHVSPQVAISQALALAQASDAPVRSLGERRNTLTRADAVAMEVLPPGGSYVDSGYMGGSEASAEVTPRATGGVGAPADHAVSASTGNVVRPSKK